MMFKKGLAFKGSFFIILLVCLFCTPALAQGQKEFSHFMIQGQISYEKADYEKAIEWWNRAIELNPAKEEEIVRFIARAQEKRAREKKSPAPPPKTAAASKNDNLAPADRIRQKRVDSYIIEGKRYYSSRRYKWAISEWQAALKIDPNNKEIADYIEKARARLDEKPSDAKPIEFSMLVNPPAPERPPVDVPDVERPTKDTLSLEDAMQIGVKNHLPLQVAREQVQLSRFREKEAFRELFPQATLRWDETVGIVSSRDYKGRKYQVKIQHPLYHGGELKYTWQQAKVNLKIALENYEKTKQDYSIQLTKAYYDYVKATKNFQVQDELLKDIEQDMAMAKKEYDSGLSILVDFLNVQSQYNQAYYAYLSSENTLTLVKSNFLQLLNLDRDPTVNIRIDTGLAFKDHNIDLEKCIELAYENRLDLHINELSLKSAVLGEQVVKSQQMPKIDLTGNIGKAGEAFKSSRLDVSDDWFIGAKVTMPIGPNTVDYSLTKENIAPSLTVFQPTKNTVNSVRFNILDNLASYTEAQRSVVTKMQAYSDLMKGKQTAASEVREAYFNYQESAIKVKNSIASKDLYRKELAITKEKRLMNDASTQDIISSKIKLAGEEVNYNNVVAENILAVAELNNAIGIKDYFK